MGTGVFYVFAGKLQSRTLPAAAGVLLSTLAGGCGGDARVELAAADSVELLATSMRRSLVEYHADLARFDAQRQRAAVQAFIERVRADSADHQAADAHAEAFRQAMQRLDADRQTAWERYSSSLDNLATLHDIAQGLRRLALQSMSLDDDLRRYFGEMMARQEEAKVLPNANQKENDNGK